MRVGVACLLPKEFPCTMCFHSACLYSFERFPLRYTTPIRLQSLVNASPAYTLSSAQSCLCILSIHSSHHSPAIVLKGLTHSDLNQSLGRCKNVQNSRFFFPKNVAARSSSASSLSSFQLRRQNVFLADRKCIRIRCIFTYRCI